MSIVSLTVDTKGSLYEPKTIPNPIKQKEELINICGHYVLSDSNFLLMIKSNFPDIDLEIKNNIKEKLNELFT